MTTSTTVLVTAPTGTIGPHAIRQLLDAGVNVRALALVDDPAAADLPDGVDVVRGDLSDPASVKSCVKGIDAVFLMWPFFTLSVDTAPAVLEIIGRQLRRVVLVSSIGVEIGLEPRDNNCHAYLEGLLQGAEMDWTFLRTTGFAANALGWAGQIRAQGGVRFPYGAAARSPVHEADLAAVAVCALTGLGHSRTTYVVTGPLAVTQADQMHAIGEAIGRRLWWEDVPAHVAREQLVGSGWPPAYADGALDYFRQLVAEPELVTSHVEEVTGRPARTFREWADEHAAAFR